MKQIIIFITLFGVFACSNQTSEVANEDKQNKKDSLVHIDTFYFDENEVNSYEYKQYYNYDFDKFINDPKTPKLAKDIYLDKDWDLRNERESLALLDSLTAKDQYSRPFYFKVVTKTKKKSDGYFSEGLGLAGKEYVENNTKEFVSYFDNKDCFTDKDLATWAEIIMLEFSIIGEDGNNKPIVDNYIKKLKVNCKDCSITQKETINKFGLKLKNEWNNYLKNIDK